MKRSSPEPNLYLIEDFLSPQECDELIIWSEQHGFEEAKVQLEGREVMLKSVRNNARIVFTDHSLAQRLWERFRPFAVQEFAGSIVSGFNERFRFYRYEPGQRFKKHRDGSYVRSEKEASFFTFMIYLNDDFEGGETTFEKHSIKPRKGMALIFEHPLKHAGEPVTRGIKYALRTDIMYTLTK
ncbi:MAG: 2OG-Fe(II) oxygenase [Bacteroidia bacterium]|nr:2OG-Fe(II) oxygenase [Bacteroidia bacterium]